MIGVSLCLLISISIGITKAQSQQQPIVSPQDTYNLDAVIYLQEPYVRWTAKALDDSFDLAQQKQQMQISKNWQFEGFLVDVVNAIMSVCKIKRGVSINIQLHYLPTLQCACGGDMPLGTSMWTGLMGAMLNKEFALSNMQAAQAFRNQYPNVYLRELPERFGMIAGPLTVTGQRARAVRFTQPLFTTGLVLISHRATAQTIVYDPVTRSAGFFLQPFDFGVWMFALLALITVSIMFALNNRFNPREIPFRQKQHGAFEILDSVHVVVSGFFLQGTRIVPRSLAARSLLYCWWFFALVFFVMYFGAVGISLVAFSTSVATLQRGGRVHSIQEAISANYTFSTTSQSSALFLLGHLMSVSFNSTDEDYDEEDKYIFRKMYDSIISLNKRKQLPNNTAELVQQIKSRDPTAPGAIIGILDSSDAAYLMRTDCDLTLVNAESSSSSSWLDQWEYAFAFPRNSPPDAKRDLYEDVNWAVIHLGEIGRMSRIYEKWFLPDKDSCNRDDDRYNRLLNDPAEFTTQPDNQPNYQAAQQLALLFQQSLPITLGTFWGPLLFLLIGIFVSFLIAICEAFYYARIERYETHDPSMQRAMFNMQLSADDGDPHI